MSRFIVRLAAGALAAAVLFAVSACAGLPTGALPVAQDTHDYIGSGTE